MTNLLLEKQGCRNQRTDCAESFSLVNIQTGSQYAAVGRKGSKLLFKNQRPKSLFSTLLTLVLLTFII